MEVQSYTAEELFDWVTQPGHDFTLLDVRNNEEFGRFKVEGPHLSKILNLPYIEFIEKEEETVDQFQVSKAESIRIVCAKEGSAKYVGEILLKNGWQDVKILEKGIKSWGNLLTPKLVASQNGYAFYQFIRPGKASCSYGLIYGDEMVVFDPSRNAQYYQDFAKKHDARIIKTFETHLQADYISGSQRLHSDTGAQIVGHQDDFKDAVFEYRGVNDQDIFRFTNEGPEIKAIHTPGHTPGSTSYLIDNKYLVTGDTVFILSIGRPDLGGKAEEWSKLLYKTLRTKIADMDDDLLILPGHYLDWSEANPDNVFVDSMGSIKAKNANIYGIAEEDEFVRFIEDNMRKQPDVYGEIRKVNAGILEVDDEEQEVMDLGKNECAASMYGQK
ncbi:MAG: MBL fold metallo-hydrolase [Desulfobacterales bacterium]|mgnify:FL=1|jgi:glyoxylase-like metal-dependent hydrolase (beta-lactamase superfamily II)/rhodanese-related sulfurtransferase